MFNCRKYYLTLAVIVGFLFIQLNAGPIRIPLDPELNAGFIEGDMILTDDQKYDLLNSDTTVIKARNGLINTNKRWPNGIVYYKITGDFDPIHRQAILTAMEIVEKRTCIRFQEADASTTQFVAITSNAGGCYSHVGYLAKEQQINLQIFPIGEGCFRTGSILHEIMHCLGFYHQQSDSQRDEYIQVVYDNIQPGKEFNFEKYSNTKITDFDVGYDYESCMHYGPIAFSQNGGDTIVPLDPKAKIGQRTGLSEKDVKKINIMYKCLIPL